MINFGAIILQERVNHEMRKTVMVFAVRDYDEEVSVEPIKQF